MANWSKMERAIQSLQCGSLAETAHEMILANYIFKTLHKKSNLLLSRNIFSLGLAYNFSLN